MYVLVVFFFFQAEDGIRDLVRSRGLGDVYKRQRDRYAGGDGHKKGQYEGGPVNAAGGRQVPNPSNACLLYTSDAADERSSVDLGGRRIIKKKNKRDQGWWRDR